MDYKVYRQDCDRRIQFWKTTIKPSRKKNFINEYIQKNQQLSQQLGIMCGYVNFECAWDPNFALCKIDGNNQEHLYYLQPLKIHKQQALVFMECKNIQSILTILNEGKSYAQLVFRGCFLGNNAAQILAIDTNPFSSGFQTLQSLRICSDPIGNRGIKELMKMSFQRIVQIEIENSNITMDSMKLLRNWQQKYCDNISVGIMKQQFFNYDSLFKQMAKIQNLNHLQTQITGTFIFKYDTFAYWGLLSKLFCRQEALKKYTYGTVPSIQVVSEVAFADYEASLLISERTKMIVHSIVTPKRIIYN